MFRRSPPVALAATLTASAVAPGGCRGAATSSTTTPLVSRGTVRIAGTSETPSFDPYSAFGASQARYTYDSLVNLAPDGGPASDLATSWRAAATTATFTLRPDVTCSDGTTLTASAVARARTYAGDPASHLAGAQTVLSNAPLEASADDKTGTVSATAAARLPFLTHTIGLLPIVCPASLDRPDSRPRARHSLPVPVPPLPRRPSARRPRYVPGHGRTGRRAGPHPVAGHPGDRRPRLPGRPQHDA